MLDLVISGGTCVLPSGTTQADIGVADGKIAVIVPDVTSTALSMKASLPARPASRLRLRISAAKLYSRGIASRGARDSGLG